MTGLVAVLLAGAAIVTLIGAIAFVRLHTPLERLHPAALVTIVAGGAMAGAGFATVGVTGQAIKLVLIVIVLIVSGALANHAVGRALHLRGGERR